MDPLSIGSSALSLHHRKNSETKIDEAFREVIASCRSLSGYDTSSIKTAVPQIIASIVAASFHIVIGISLAYSAILIPQLEDSKEMPLTVTQSSLIASVIVIAVPVGCLLFAGFLMESIGRLNTIKLAAIPCCIGWILIATASNFSALLIGRILTGLGCAIGTSPAIVYITEVARPDLRGSLISSAPTLASLGMVIAYTEGAFLPWRLVAWINIVYTIIPIILIQFIVPESPVWLITKGRVEDAAKSLQFLYKAYPQPEHTSQTVADMHLQALQKEHETQYMTKNFSKSDFTQISEHNSLFTSKLSGFLKPTGYKPMIILFWFFLIQQFSGIYITLFYAVTFCKDIGTTVDPFKASIFVGVTRLMMSLLNAWLLKRFKRRPLVMVSCVGMAICMGVSGLFTKWILEGTTTYTWVPVVCLLLYVCCSMVGLLIIPWTMTAELFPTDIRGLGHSISYSMANFLMFIAVQSYRFLVNLGGAHSLQWFFAAVSMIGFAFAVFFLPETHGKKLTEITEYFESKKKDGTSKTNKGKGNQVYGKQGSTYSKKPNLETVEEAEKMITTSNKV